jgi:hypothetical protein
MNKVTFSPQTVVAIKVKGTPRNFPSVPDDKGVIVRLLNFISFSGLYPVGSMGGFSGGGGYLAFFKPEDSVKIIEWLVANGAVLDHDKTWSRE